MLKTRNPKKAKVTTKSAIGEAVTAGEVQQTPEAGEKLEERMMYYVPQGVKSFADLLAAEDALDKSEVLECRTSQLSQIIYSILYDPMETDKVSSMRRLFDEFIGIAADALGAGEIEETQKDPNALKFTESETVEILAISEADYLDDDEDEDEGKEKGKGKKNPLMMEVAIIRPGWGNKRDNFYYSREMLAKHAEAFVGAKQYETDHKQEEKSTRTWVSTVTGISRFLEDGTPVAKVAIHDPHFAERVMNLKKAGLLNKMECSILAGGTARGGYKEGGREGRYVETIDNVQAVDWVTSAGAGGHALDLSESAKGEPSMDKTQKPTEKVEEVATPETPETSKVKMTENQPEKTFLSEVDVKATLEMTHLPVIAQERIMEGKFENLTELNAAISKEKKYLQTVAGAGNVVGMGETNSQSQDTVPDYSEVENALSEVDRKYFGR